MVQRACAPPRRCAWATPIPRPDVPACAHRAGHARPVVSAVTAITVRIAVPAILRAQAVTGDPGARPVAGGSEHSPRAPQRPVRGAQICLRAPCHPMAIGRAIGRAVRPRCAGPQEDRAARAPRLPVGTMRTLHKDLSLAPPQDGRRRSRAPRYGVSVSSTMRTSCAKDEAPIFSMTRARWISTVR